MGKEKSGSTSYNDGGLYVVTFMMPWYFDRPEDLKDGFRTVAVFVPSPDKALDAAVAKARRDFDDEGIDAGGIVAVTCVRAETKVEIVQ